MCIRDRHGIQWRQWEQDADTRAAQLAGTPVPLDYKTTEDKRIINFLGYAYKRCLLYTSRCV